MNNDCLYRELLSIIIKSKLPIFGPLVLKIARENGNFVLSDSGDVYSFSDDPVLIIENFLLAFERIAGKTSTITARMANSSFKKRNPGFKLPALLIKQD